MSNLQLLSPDRLRVRVAKLYASRQHIWLHDSRDWPLSINLGCPTEQQAIDLQDATLDWVNAWREWQGPGKLFWHSRQWRRIGIQDLPEKILFERPEDVADLLGEGARWRRAAERFATLAERWPAVSGKTKVFFDALADFDCFDFEILQQVVQWFLENRCSNLYPRQLPVAGAHTKWLEGKQRVVCALVGCATGLADYNDMYELLGLRRPTLLWRMRILDSSIRQHLGWLEDISAPLVDFQRLPIVPHNIVIVENLQTFLAFEDLKDTIVLLGMGFRVKELAEIEWLRSARCLYWGDLDTSGLAILNMVRGVLPKIKSILMDEATLLANKSLWVEEKKQHSALTLPNLSPVEDAVYRGLQEHKWGTNVRLEQERLPWQTAWATIVGSIQSI